ncbi:hypothetical protein ABIC66_003873 [Caulobacter sp. 1776]
MMSEAAAVREHARFSDLADSAYKVRSPRLPLAY